jgi:hypothetical protein
MKRVNKEGRTCLSGADPIAIDIVRAFGLDPDSGVITHVNFDLDSQNLATLKVWYEVIEQDIGVPKLTAIFKEYELVERVKDDEQF